VNRFHETCFQALQLHPESLTRNIAHEIELFPRHCEELLRRSNPFYHVRKDGLLRCARNDGETAQFLGQHFESGSKEPGKAQRSPAPRRIAACTAVACGHPSKCIAFAILPGDAVRRRCRYDSNFGNATRVNTIKRNPLHCEQSCSPDSNDSAVRSQGDGWIVVSQDDEARCL